MFVLIYVDSILVMSSTIANVDGLLHNMRLALLVKDLGTIDYFLGIEVTIQPDGILLSQ